MSLFTKIIGEVADLGRFVSDDYRNNQLVREVRREHDAWVRTAQLHVPYYTIKPTVEKRADMPWTRDEHAQYVFVGRAQWPYTGELATANKAPSWRLWLNNGPFTLDPKPTAQSHRIADALAEAAELAYMRDRVNAGLMAELERMFPASVALHR